MDNYLNKYSNKKKSTKSHKRALSSYNKYLKNGGNKVNKSFVTTREKSKNREKYGNEEDYKKN